MFPCAAVEVKNEPILGFKEGSQERAELLKVNKHTLSYTCMHREVHGGRGPALCGAHYIEAS